MQHTYTVKYKWLLRTTELGKKRGKGVLAWFQVVIPESSRSLDFRRLHTFPGFCFVSDIRYSRVEDLKV